MSPIRTSVACAVGALAGLLLAAVPAVSAEVDTDNCETVVSTLTDRPDSAVGGGTWALDQIERTVTICEGDSLEGVSNYHAEVVDEGTFVTLSLDHTPAGADQPLPAGIEGTMTGGFTAAFEADAGFESFDASHLDGQTITWDEGGDNLSTGQWVASMFGNDFDGTSLNDDWSWTYATCAEQWINQTRALGGNEGDITGSPLCVQPEEPTVTDETCDGSGALTIPEVEGVTYLIEDEAIEPGTSDVEPGDVQVSAAADEGYALEAESAWELTVGSAENCPGPEGSAGEEPDEVATTTPTPTRKRLPDTGASPVVVAGAGALLVLLGGYAIVLGRRTARTRRHHA